MDGWKAHVGGVANEMSGPCCFSSLCPPLSVSSSPSRRALLSSPQTPNPSRPPPPPLIVRISSSLLPRPRRRSRSRRNHRRTPTIPSPPPSSIHSDEVDVSLSLGIDDTLSKASASLRRFYRDLLSSGDDACNDLRSSVRVDYEARRIGFSCRRSSLVFVANVLVACLVAVVSTRAVLWLSGLLFRSSWRGGSRRSVVKRDRSLGGREVVVGRRSSSVRESGMQVTPLTLGRMSRMMRRDRMLQGKQRPRRDRVPGWWPTRLSSHSPPLSSSYVGMEDSQGEAAMLVRAIMDDRMSGRDYKEDDIVQLRRICRAAGARVHFDTANARDSFFRTSIDFALNVCSRAGQSITNVKVDGEEIRQFLAGLAYNIGLDDMRAVILLCAAVAAKTRSCFLQALALEVQGKRSEALEELSKISRIHQAFPPEDQSPEIEMVASGLRKNLKLEQREHLLNLLEEVSNSEGRRIAAAALGLQIKFKNSKGKDHT